MVVNHKVDDEKYSEKEKIVTLKLSNDDVETIKNIDGCIIEENYEIHGASNNYEMVDVPVSIEEYKNNGGKEYSDNPKEFIPCDPVIGEKGNEVLSWNIECVAGEPKKNKYTGKGVKVAVIDSGIDVHNDLNTKGWVDFSDKVNGYKPIDNSGHGTEMAGVIAARKNGIGTIGIAPDAEVYSVKILDKDNKANVSSVVKAIEWCIENDMDIINMSFGLEEYSSILYNSIKKAYEHNILLVAAAGNEGRVEYPAKFREVLSVGGIDSNLNVSSFSPEGVYVDLFAPAEQCQTTGFVGSYVISSGTSIATAHVTGVAAAVKSIEKAISNKNLMNLLKKSAVLCNNTKGYYRIVNYENAVKLYFSKDIYEKDNIVIIDEDNLEEVKDNNSYVNGSWSSDYWQCQSASNGTGHYSMINCLDTKYFAVGGSDYTSKCHNRWIVADSAYLVDKIGSFRSWDDDTLKEYKYEPYHANTHYTTHQLCAPVNFLYELARQRLVLEQWLAYNPNSYNNKDEYKGVFIPAEMKKKMISNMNDMDITLKTHYGNTNIDMNKTSSQGYMIMGVLLHLIGDFYCHRAKVTKEMLYASEDGRVCWYDVFGETCENSHIWGGYFDGRDDNRGMNDYWRVFQYIAEYDGIPINRLKEKMHKTVTITIDGKTYPPMSAAQAFEDNPYFYSNRYLASCYVVEAVLSDMMNKKSNTVLYGFDNWGVPLYEQAFNYKFQNEKWGID